MHDTAEYTDEKEIIDQKAIELAEDFSYDGYQVVRRELFAHLREPAVVIRRDSVTFNTACIAGLEDAVYIQILVNQDSKRKVHFWIAWINPHFIHITARFPAANLMPSLLQLSRQLSCSPGRVIRV